MKPRIHQIRSLYHRWSRKVGIDAYHAYLALLDAGLVKPAKYSELGFPSHYEETAKLKSADDIDELIFETLTEYKVQRGL